MSERDPDGGWSNRKFLSEVVDLTPFTAKEQEYIKLYQTHHSKYMELNVFFYGSMEQRLRRDDPRYEEVYAEYQSIEKELTKLENSAPLARVLKVIYEEKKAELARRGEEALAEQRRRDQEYLEEFTKKWAASRADAVESKNLQDEIANLFGWDRSKLTEAQRLILMSAFYCKKHFCKENCFLGSYDITRADTIAFVTFVVRAMVIGSTDDREVAELFSNDYVSSMVKVIEHFYIQKSELNSFLDNRFGFYDEVFASHDGIEDKISALIEEFEYIIKTDIINKKYVPYSSESPLAVLSYDKDEACQIEVQAFYNEFMEKMQNNINDVQENISLLYFEDEPLSPKEFYKEAILKFHKQAEENGLCNKGIVAIPELIAIGQKTVLAFLRDQYLNLEYGNNPNQFYYVVSSFCLQCGIIFAAEWRDNFSSLNQDYVDRVIADGPWEHVELLFKEDLGMSKDEFNELCKRTYDLWLELHDPYWKLDDPREYTFNALLAVFQLGISIILSVGSSPIVPQRIQKTETNTAKVENDNRFCWKCGAKLIDGGDFCIKCGTQATALEESANQSNKSRTVASNSSFSSGSTHPQQKKSLVNKLREIDPDKRNKIIKFSIIGVVALVVLILIINAAVNSAQNAQLRNFATEKMSDDYTNVYAEIISMEPEYFVETSYNGGSYSISDVVCRCETVEGKYIWVVIDSWDYPGAGYGYDEDDFESKYYSKYNPLRVTGRVTRSGDIIAKLKTSIGDVFVLEAEELDN